MKRGVNRFMSLLRPALMSVDSSIMGRRAEGRLFSAGSEIRGAHPFVKPDDIINISDTTIESKSSETLGSKTPGIHPFVREYVITPFVKPTGTKEIKDSQPIITFSERVGVVSIVSKGRAKPQNGIVSYRESKGSETTPGLHPFIRSEGFVAKTSKGSRGFSTVASSGGEVERFNPIRNIHNFKSSESIDIGGEQVHICQSEEENNKWFVRNLNSMSEKAARTEAFVSNVGSYLLGTPMQAAIFQNREGLYSIGSRALTNYNPIGKMGKDDVTRSLENVANLETVMNILLARAVLWDSSSDKARNIGLYNVNANGSEQRFGTFNYKSCTGLGIGVRNIRSFEDGSFAANVFSEMEFLKEQPFIDIARACVESFASKISSIPRSAIFNLAEIHFGMQKEELSELSHTHYRIPEAKDSSKEGYALHLAEMVQSSINSFSELREKSAHSEKSAGYSR
jgi:hypothetical protein